MVHVEIFCRNFQEVDKKAKSMGTFNFAATTESGCHSSVFKYKVIMGTNHSVCMDVIIICSIMYITTNTNARVLTMSMQIYDIESCAHSNSFLYVRSLLNRY